MSVVRRCSLGLEAIVKVLFVSVVLLLLATHVDARAEKTKCKYEELGLGYVKVREGTKNWTYVVTLAGPQLAAMAVRLPVITKTWGGPSGETRAAMQEQ
jgi:hypothetical protein